LEKKRILVEFLSRVPAEEKAAAVGWLVAEPLCGPLGVGPAQLWELSSVPARAGPPILLREVEEALASRGRAVGSSRGAAASRVAALFERLTEPERALVTGALTGSLRQGSLGGVMILALAETSGRGEAEVRRAVLVGGSIAAATEALLGTGRETARATTLVVFRPLSPMLAASAASLEEALASVKNAIVEWKIDGVRAQVHKQGGRVVLYSRQGRDITAGCGSVVLALASVDAEEAVLDGEIVLLGPGGAPRPFQDSFSAIASKGEADAGGNLTVYLFDCLYRDGVDLINEPLSVRAEALRAVAPADLHVPSVRPATLEAAKQFYAEALAAGHEGVMVKDLSSPYRLGARGRAWQKVKESTSVDLVVLAAEWGSGRRKGWLSNLHLGARQDDGSFCMVGKTFKGLTDALLRWQTVELERLATERTEHLVRVRPELVVEIRFNDVQRSPRYPGRIALRFARVVRYREDKSADQVEPLSSLVARLREPLDPPRKKNEKQLSLF
jgi:DNA ligase-1